MHLKHIVLLLLVFATLPVLAQSRLSSARRNARARSVADVIRSYEDSMRVYKLKLDSVYALNDSLNRKIEVDDSLYRLFIPLSYYKSAAHRNLSLESQDSTTLQAAIDRALMNIYLRRPDLVVNSESHLQNVGAPVVEEPHKQQVAPDIVEMVSPEAVEPEAAPLDLVIKKPNFWSFSGDYSMQFMQNYVSGNWYKGGQSSYSMIGSLTLQANYNNKQKVKWDNKLEMKLGFQAVRDDTLHHVKTSEDLIRYTGKLGLQATKKWYYTLQVVASTQFMRSYRDNDKTVYSDFMSPFKLNVSLGMDYNVSWLKNRLTGSIHLAPFSYNFTYVDRLSLSTRYGVDEGKHGHHDYGSLISMDLTWKIHSNVKWKSRYYAYTTYERVEMEWENTVSFQFNKYITANFFFYPRFDDSRAKDDHHGYFMYKEYLSLGFSYSF